MGSKEHVFVLVKGKNGQLEKREVKQDSSHHKITDNMKRKFEEGVRFNKRYGKPLE